MEPSPDSRFRASRKGARTGTGRGGHCFAGKGLGKDRKPAFSSAEGWEAALEAARSFLEHP
jgi:hypothetical protein